MRHPAPPLPVTPPVRPQLRRLPGQVKEYPGHALQRWLLEPIQKSALNQLEGRVLDVGAGPQRYRAFAPATVEWVTADIGPHHRSSVVADAHNLPFADHTYDGMVLFELLEHTRSPGHVLCEASRLLRPGGKLLLSVPFHWNIHHAPADYWRFTPYGLAELLNRASLAVDNISPVGGVFAMAFARIGDHVLQRLWKIGGRHFARRFFARIAYAALTATGAALWCCFDEDAADDAIGWFLTCHKPLPEH